MKLLITLLLTWSLSAQIFKNEILIKPGINLSRLKDFKSNHMPALDFAFAFYLNSFDELNLRLELGYSNFHFKQLNQSYEFEALKFSPVLQIPLTSFADIRFQFIIGEELYILNRYLINNNEENGNNHLYINHLLGLNTSYPISKSITIEFEYTYSSALTDIIHKTNLKLDSQRLTLALHFYLKD